jgi:hypothetical protein
MPKGPRGEKRLGDVIGAAIMVAKIATGEVEETKGTYPAAVSAVALAVVKVARLEHARSALRNRASGGERPVEEVPLAHVVQLGQFL